MVKRRDLAFGVASFGVAALVGARTALAVPATVEDAAPLDLMTGPGGSVPTLEDFKKLYGTHTGTQTPFAEEVAKAQTILGRAPTEAPPFVVASFFFRLNEGEAGPERALYAREWPERANPVIVTFFDATANRVPEKGDVTPWCAAFVSWCLRRAAESRSEEFLGSAASRWYRTWGENTDNPLVGDLVVFENKTDRALGHVGFYISQTEDHVFVLGGNQRTMLNLSNGEVTVSMYAKDGQTLRLHSFRTHQLLHNSQ